MQFDVYNQCVFIFTNSDIVKIIIENEDKNVWELYVQAKMFKEAFFVAKKN